MIMAELNSVQSEVRKLNKNYTLNVSVKITREFKMRMRLASYLWRLSAWILDCGIEFDWDEKNETQNPG